MSLKRLIQIASALIISQPACSSVVWAQDNGSPGPVAGTPFERRIVADSSGRAITYYMSRPKRATAPVMLMIQGSGCTPVLTVGHGGASSSVFNLAKYAAEGKFTVVAVEKPFAGTSAQSGPSLGCSDAFNADFTADSWRNALQASLADARRAPWVDSTRTLVFGSSEGAVMSAVLAAADPTITDLIFVSGSGATQLFDFVVQAYSGCFDASACLRDIDRNVAAIQADPTSSTAMAWGHPHKRWTSFFAIDPGELLLKSRARVYIAIGTADDSVPAISQELAAAKLLLARRDVTVRRVIDGTHNLNQRGARDYEALDREQRTALEWFDRPPKR